MSLLVGNKVVKAKIVKIDKSGYIITFQKINDEKEREAEIQTIKVALPAQLVHPISIYKFWNGNIVSIKCPETLRKVDLHRYKYIFKERKEGERITAICTRLLKNKKIENVRLDPCLKRDLGIYRSGIQKAKLRSPQYITKYKNIQRLSRLVNDDLVLEGCFECSEVIAENRNEENDARRTIRALSTGNLQILDRIYDKFKIDAAAITRISECIKWLKNYNLPSMQQLNDKFTTKDIMSSFLPDNVFHSSSSFSSSEYNIPQNVIDFYGSKPYVDKVINLDNFDAVCHFVASLRQNLTQPPIGSQLESSTVFGFTRVGIIQPQKWPENEMTRFLLRLPIKTYIIPLGLNENEIFQKEDFPKMTEKSITNPVLENLLDPLILPHNIFELIRALFRALHVPKIRESITKWYIEGDCEIDNETVRIIFANMGLTQCQSQTETSFFGTKEVEKELSKLLNEEDIFNQKLKNQNLKRGTSLQKLKIHAKKRKKTLLLISPDEEEEIYALVQNVKGIETWRATPHPYKDEFSIVNFAKNFISYLTNQKCSRQLTNTCLFLNVSKWKRSLLSRIIYFTQVNNYKITGHISM